MIHASFRLMLLVFTLLLTMPAKGEQLFEKGLQAYQSSNFQKASKLFEKALEEKPSSDGILFNLGNSYLKQEKIGLAISSYRRALNQNPTLEAAKKNLEMARLKVPSAFEQKNRNSFPLEWLREWRSFVFLCSIVLSLGATLLTIYGKSFFAPLGLLLLASVSYLATWGLKNDRLGEISSWGISPSKYAAGVVGEEGLIARTSPDSNSVAILKLVEGEEILTDSLKDGWARLQLPGNRLGWVKQEKLYFLKE